MDFRVPHPMKYPDYVFTEQPTTDQLRQRAVEAMRDFLAENGIRTWMAPHDIPAGSKYAQVINHALRDCACLVLMLTNESQSSTWVAKEVERAYFPKRNLVYSEEQRASLLRAVESKTPAEINKNREFIALKRQARIEGRDPNEVARPEMKNSDYFVNLTTEVLSSGDWQSISVVRKEMEGMGELFLEAAGLTPEGVLRGAMVKEDRPAQVADMMEKIRQGLSTGNQGLINSYLEQYIGQHPFLDTSQMAGTLAQMILQQLCAVSEKAQLAVKQDLHGFKVSVGSVAILREQGSLDNTKGPAGETVEQQRRLPGGAKIADALMTHNQIERFFKEKLDAIAAERARQRQMQQMLQNEANQGGQEPMMGQGRAPQA